MKSFEYWLKLTENLKQYAWLGVKSYIDADNDTVYEIPVNGEYSKFFVQHLDDEPNYKDFVLQIDPKNWIKTKDGYLYLAGDIQKRINGVKESKIVNINSFESYLNSEGLKISKEKNKEYCQYLIDTMKAYDAERVKSDPKGVLLYGKNNPVMVELQEFIDGTGRNDLKGRKDMRPVETQIQGDNFWLNMQYKTLNMWNIPGGRKFFDLMSYKEWDEKHKDNNESIEESHLIDEKLSAAAKEYISDKIKKLKEEGYPQKQAVAIAYSYAKKKKYKIDESDTNKTKDVTELKKGDKVNIKSSGERAIIVSKVNSTNYIVKTKSGDERRVNLNAIEPIFPIGKNNENSSLETYSLGLEEYQNKVASAIIKEIPEKVLKYTGTDIKDIIFIMSSKLIDGENILNYPDHFNTSIQDYWENNKSVQDAIDYFSDDVKLIINTQARAM